MGDTRSWCGTCSPGPTIQIPKLITRKVFRKSCKLCCNSILGQFVRAFKVNFTRREYQKCGENIKWRYSENDTHAARESGLTSKDAFLCYTWTYVRQNRNHFLALNIHFNTDCPRSTSPLLSVTVQIPVADRHGHRPLHWNVFEHFTSDVCMQCVRWHFSIILNSKRDSSVSWQWWIRLFADRKIWRKSWLSESCFWFSCGDRYTEWNELASPNPSFITPPHCADALSCSVQSGPPLPEQ